MAPVVLLFKPLAVPMTFAAVVQDPPAAIVPALSEMLPLPATAVTAPPHVDVTPLGVATASPAGNVSMKLTPVNAVATFGLFSVNVRAVVPPTRTPGFAKAFAIVGGIATTVTSVVALLLMMFASTAVPGVKIVAVLTIVPVAAAEIAHVAV
jgi:hypothetical protein